MVEGRQKTKKKFYFIVALLTALVISTGAFAYTFTTATATFSVVPMGDIATVAEAAGQPDWGSVLPDSGGPGQEILRPDAAGDVTGCSQFPPPGENWDKVAEEDPDGYETCVYTRFPAFYKTDLYNIQDHYEGSGTINGITVYFVVSGDEHHGTPLTTYARAVIKTDGTVRQGDEEVLTGKTFVTKYYIWLNNPETGAAWTWDEIDDLQVGVRLKGAAVGKSYCTQVFVVVDYEEEGVTNGNVPIGDLFEVTVQPDYTGDLAVSVYLLNSGSLVKAYQYLNIKLELEGSAEGTYQLLSLGNGLATFKLEFDSSGTHTLSVSGGSFGLISDEPSEWEEGWSVTPELYCEVIQK